MKTVKFNEGDNVFMLIGKLKKVLSIEDFEEFNEELKSKNNYYEVIKLAESYVELEEE